MPKDYFKNRSRSSETCAGPAFRLADLVLLEANPLEDIRNIQRINAVIMNGRFFDRKTLDKMPAQAQTLATQR